MLLPRAHIWSPLQKWLIVAALFCIVTMISAQRNNRDCFCSSRFDACLAQQNMSTLLDAQPTQGQMGLNE